MRLFSAGTRGANLTGMAEDRFDVLVIGGGITGTGIALDAASRGFSVALVEKDDFASGTSGRSSRMIHGGLRYLEQYEVGLVHEGRHTAVSIMSSNGVPIQDISDTVGHKSTHVTETVYRHVIVPAIRGGATVMDNVFDDDEDDTGEGSANAGNDLGSGFGSKPPNRGPINRWS